MPDETKRTAGPAIYAVDPWVPGKPRGRHQLLSDDERALLARIASIVRFNKGEHIYHAGDAADAVFNIITAHLRRGSTSRRFFTRAICSASQRRGITRTQREPRHRSSPTKFPYPHCVVS